MKRRELLGFWIALAILAAVAGLTYRSIDATASTLDWVEHSHRVSERLDDVSAAYARAVAARRSFLIAGDESQLPELATLDARLDTSIAELRQLVASDPPALDRLDQLATLLEQRVHDLQISVAKRQAGVSAPETAEGLALGARIREVREDLERTQSQRLADRDAATRRDVVRTKLAEVVGTCLSFTILLLAFRRMVLEIRKRRDSEQALRANETFLDSIIENIPNMLFVKDAKRLSFQRINRAGEELLGVDRSALLRKTDYDFFPPDQAAAFQMMDRETLSRGEILDILEEPIQAKSGARWLHTKKVPIADEHGTPLFLLGISEDITERRRAAAQLKAAKDAAESANQELEAFTYAVAHDLRAPLRAIDGFSLALEEDCQDKLEESGREYLGRVRTSAKGMAERIDGLLELSRVSRGEFAVTSVDVTKIAEQCVANLRQLDPDRVVTAVVQEGLLAQGDPRLVSSIFDNLLGNAWKFTAKQPCARIDVGSVSENGSTAFFVRDNGAGFNQAYSKRLFGAFQRLHRANEFEGTGIGLATVQRIVHRHGGKIWAEGEVDRGATFYFTL